MNTSGQPFHIGFEFNGPVNFTRVELDLFNCPEWGIAAQSITVYEFNFGILNFDAAIARRLNLVLGWTTTNSSSCTTIVRVLIPLLELPQNPTTSYVIDFTFDNTATSYSIQWVHTAEVRFLGEEGTQCPTPTSTAGMITHLASENHLIIFMQHTIYKDSSTTGISQRRVGHW